MEAGSFFTVLDFTTHYVFNYMYNYILTITRKRYAKSFKDNLNFVNKMKTNKHTHKHKQTRCCEKQAYEEHPIMVISLVFQNRPGFGSNLQTLQPYFINCWLTTDHTNELCYYLYTKS